MEQNNKNTQEQKEAAKDAISKLIRIASVMIAIAIVGVCFAYTKLDGAGIGQIVVYAVSALLALLGAFVIFVMAYGTHLDKHRNNLFLYDKKTKKDIPVSELTVDRIRERLVMQMAVFKRGGKLYVGDLFESRVIMVPEAIKTLFCYELLCEIADEKGADPSVFLSFGAECADIFTKYLGANNDHELALKIKGYFFAYADDKSVAEEFCEYVKSKKEHLQQSMLDFTVKNIEKFK